MPTSRSSAPILVPSRPNAQNQYGVSLTQEDIAQGNFFVINRIVTPFREFGSIAPGGTIKFRGRVVRVYPVPIHTSSILIVRGEAASANG